jgi:hypothetical protein
MARFVVRIAARLTYVTHHGDREIRSNWRSGERVPVAPTVNLEASWRVLISSVGEAKGAMGMFETR